MKCENKYKKGEVKDNDEDEAESEQLRRGTMILMMKNDECDDVMIMINRMIMMKVIMIVIMIKMIMIMIATIIMTMKIIIKSIDTNNMIMIMITIPMITKIK